VCKFSPNDDVCVCNEDGMIEIISSSRYRFSGHDNAIFDCTWNYDGTMIGTASADCKPRLWDLVTSTLVYELKGHEACVKSISFDNDNPNILVTSSRDNSISIWDKRFENKKNSNGTTISLPIKKIADSHGYKKKCSSVVTAAAFLDHRPFKIVSVGSSDGIIKLWDYRASLKKCAAFVKPQSNINSNGFSSLALSNNGSTIYTSCLNNSIISIDSNTLECMDVYKHKDFNCSSFYIKMDVSFCGDYIACGSRNGNIYLWEAFKKTDPLLLVGHRQEVTAVAWSKRDYKVLL
jgi:denticleless